jgi:hypothetical protein
MRPYSILLIVLLAAPKLCAQKLSLGIVGGGSLTDSFQTVNLIAGPPGVPTLQSYSQSKDFIVGLAVEYRFTPHWSLEADGLYRKLHMTFAGVEADGTLNSVSPSPVITWEFPVLVKYRFPQWRVHPIVELGPSFRTAGNLNGSNPSHTGATAGAGLEFHTREFTISPVLRYTRWTNDDVFLGQPKSNPNQVELLVELTSPSASVLQPFGKHFLVGVVAGTTLSNDVQQRTEGPSGTTNFINTATPLKSAIVGPMIGVKLPLHLSIEADVLYDPLNVQTAISMNGVQRRPYSTTSPTWELPILAKYKFSAWPVKPLIEAGPAFRLATGPLSNHGVTAGMGVEIAARFLKISPEVRYTHWASETMLGITQTSPNQAELLVGFYF